MSRCIDSRFEKKLFAYELDLLGDRETEEVELHLLECVFCCNKVQKFHETSQLFRHNDEIRKHITGMADGLKEDKSRGTRIKDFIRPWRRPALMRISLVAIIVLLFLIIRPWRMEIYLSDEAIAAQNRLTILYFDNLIQPEDPDNLGEITANLLITDLSNSQYLRVLSRQQLNDILNRLGQKEIRKIGKDLAAEIATEANARWMLTGQIVRTTPYILITSQLFEIESGEVIVTQKIKGEENESVFSLIDKLSTEIKRDISLPDKALKEPDRQVAEITTHSQDAYRYYIKGINHLDKMYIPQAIESFEKALEIDSTFAMVYYYLSKIKEPGFIFKALKYSDKTGRNEKPLITSSEAAISGDYDRAIADLRQLVEEFPEEKEAYYWMAKYYYEIRRFEEAVSSLLKAIEIDSLYKLAYNFLAYTYNAMDDLVKSIEAVDKYIQIASDEANPYDTKGNIYALNGKYDLAIEAFNKALEITPDFPFTIQQLGHVYLFKNELNKADSLYREMGKVGDQRNKYWARFFEAQVNLRRGQFDRALMLLDGLVGTDTVGIFETDLAYKHLLLAMIYWQINNTEMAESEFQKCQEICRSAYPDNVHWFRHHYVQFLSETGETDKAEAVAEQLEKDLIKSNQNLWSYWYALGAIEFSRSNYELAIDYMLKIDDSGFQFPASYMVARAYLMTGQADSAISLIGKQLSAYTTLRIAFSIRDIKSYYYLGRAYEQVGRASSAIEQYEIFLKLWKNADTPVAEKDDAIQRLQILKQ